MRISTQMMQRNAVTSILDRQFDLNRTQQQLASGKKILSPAEDPSGTTQILNLQQKLDQSEQYQSNIDRLKSRLEVEETVISSAGDTFQRIRELAVQGLSDSNGQDNRKAIAAEVWQKLDELLDLANSKDGGGEYLFSGFQSQTPPFTDLGGGNYQYNGDQGQRQLQISSTRSIQSSDSGSAIFENLDSLAAGGKQNVFKTIYDFATALEADNPAGNVLADIDTAMDKLFQVRAEIGGRINAVDAQAQINEQYDVQVKSIMSGIQDLDYAEAIGQLNLELAGLQAAQASFQKVQNLSLFNFL